MTMRRRLIVGAPMIALQPRLVFPQAPKGVPRIGFLVFSNGSFPFTVDSFRAGMRELGYVEGKTHVLDIRNAEGQPQRMPELAAELVRMNVDVLVATSTEGTEAAKNATKTIPVVFGGSADAVARGLVGSLARPGGNLTGTSYLYPEIAQKQIELLKSAAPKLKRISVLRVQTGSLPVFFLEPMSATAKKLGILFIDRPLTAVDAGNVETVFRIMQQDDAQGIVVSPHPLFAGLIPTLTAQTLRLRMPSVYPYPEAPRAGGLISYFPRIQDSFKRMAYYVDRILKGAKPADLPVEQPTKFHMVINQKTAGALGLSLPKELLLRADEVIE